MEIEGCNVEGCAVCLDFEYPSFGELLLHGFDLLVGKGGKG